MLLLNNIVLTLMIMGGPGLALDEPENSKQVSQKLSSLDSPEYLSRLKSSSEDLSQSKSTVGKQLIETNTDSDAEVSTEADAEDDTEADTEENTESDAEAGTEADTETNTETDTETVNDSSTDTNESNEDSTKQDWKHVEEIKKPNPVSEYLKKSGGIQPSAKKNLLISKPSQDTQSKREPKESAQNKPTEKINKTNSEETSNKPSQIQKIENKKQLVSVGSADNTLRAEEKNILMKTEEPETPLETEQAEVPIEIAQSKTIKDSADLSRYSKEQNVNSTLNASEPRRKKLSEISKTEPETVQAKPEDKLKTTPTKLAKLKLNETIQSDPTIKSVPSYQTAYDEEFTAPKDIQIFKKLVGKYKPIVSENFRCKHIGYLYLLKDSVFVRSICNPKSKSGIGYVFGRWGVHNGKYSELIGPLDAKRSLIEPIRYNDQDQLTIGATKLISRSDAFSMDHLTKLFGLFVNPHCSGINPLAVTFTPSGTYQVSSCDRQYPLTLESGTFQIISITSYNITLYIVPTIGTEREISVTLIPNPPAIIYKNNIKLMKMSTY